MKWIKFNSERHFQEFSLTAIFGMGTSTNERVGIVLFGAIAAAQKISLSQISSHEFLSNNFC